MSGRPATIGSTLAGGIQDISALLPLIGTEQCETHVGSALQGGYLYAAATPLSIFGSLGIVKAGISILVSSISIPVPKISISFNKLKPTIVYSPQRKWLGAKMLHDAGFKFSGTVAPLIGMDGQCFKAETRLLEILKEKHIDDPGKVSVAWKCRHWNSMLIISTLIGATLSTIPYIALFFGPASWNPTRIHLPWLYPALRIVGSCFATIACQFIIQGRIVTLMKYRILFMGVDQEFTQGRKAGLKEWLNDMDIDWDPNLPAQHCLWSLTNALSSMRPSTRPTQESRNADQITTNQIDSTTTQFPTDKVPEPVSNSAHISIPTTTLPPAHISTEEQVLLYYGRYLADILDNLHQEHFPSPTWDTAVTFFAWVILGLSLPATIAGYIGCFTLVNSTQAQANGPLVWVGLEATLSILRIIIWAWNPSFDEKTEIDLQLKLSQHQPLVTTNFYDPCTFNYDEETRRIFNLVPEDEFMERITPFTGPLDLFQKADNITLYFTLTTDYGRTPGSNNFGPISGWQPECQLLLITVFDVNMQHGVTIILCRGKFCYFDVHLTYDSTKRKFQANLRSPKRDVHPWRPEDNNFFMDLKGYYWYLVHALNRSTTILTGKFFFLDSTRKFN